MAQCVYCRKQADSAEDWFPRWLGKYKHIGLLKDRLCNECNNRLGITVDQAMSDQSPETVNRHVLGIQGRDKKPPKDPTQFKAQAAPPTTLKPLSSKVGFIPLMTWKAPGIARWKNQIVFDRSPDPIAVTEDFSAEWLRAGIQDRDLAGARITDIVWDGSKTKNGKELPVDLRRKLGEAIPTFERDFKEKGILLHPMHDDDPVAYEVAHLSITFTPLYARALAKIAFHYLLKFDRHIDGLEPGFDNIKAFIMEGVGVPESFVLMGEALAVVDQGDRPGMRHYLLLQSDTHNDLRLYLQLFCNAPIQTIAMRIRLGRDPFVRQLRIGHSITVLEKPQEGFNGECFELRPQRLGNRIRIVERPIEPR